MSVEITAAAMRKLAENIENDSDPSLFKAMKGLRQAADALDALEASQARVRELEDDNSALKLSLASGGGRLSSGAKIWLQQKERAEQAEARVEVLREALQFIRDTWTRPGTLVDAHCEKALSTLDPAAERLLAERKLLREVAEAAYGVSKEHHQKHKRDRLDETLTALNEFDDKETK